MQKKGFTAYAPANPLRGLTSDSEYVKSFLATIPGPVVLVGHSYGGAVITNAAYGSPNVKALVYIAAYALAEGENVDSANSLGGGVSDLLPNVGPPAWKTVPSWYLVAHDDQAIPPVAERFMAKRAGAHTVEIRSSHVAMVSHPEAVTSLVLSAARTIS